MSLNPEKLTVLLELAFLSDPTVGELRIASTESVAAGFLPAVIKQFTEEQPRVRLHVTQAVMNTTHYRDLRERSIDLLLGRIPAPFGESDLEAEGSLRHRTGNSRS